MARRSDIVSASEISSWAWCEESWRLQSLGNEPTNRHAMDEGTALHAEKAVFEGHSRSAISVGWGVIAVAVLIAGMVLLLMRS